MGTGVLLLLLGTPLVTLLILHLQGQAELRAVRAQLEAAGTPLLLDPHAAQIRKDQLGGWLQGLGLGWRYHRGTLYFFSRDRKGWEDAERACRAWHCHLASVTSPEEQDFLAREVGPGSYWIGLTSQGPGGAWRWVDGTPYSLAQSFWAPGQPDSRDHGPWGQELCAQIHPVGNGLWNDHNCNFSFPWVCKRVLGSP
ncbi:C-type lectin domain family 4 member F-like isoform X2 [Calypte anna]|uniref:C-type lectin domain family 4 member F-like isoform X2 n=1 Tax=Calypte anna TaxID=9244 RepID=UPI0011C37C16|nr:C-type lectin domain family 4 member F-like isoform X2 [Calypte anna]